jgi:hypothetical protein
MLTPGGFIVKTVLYLQEVSVRRSRGLTLAATWGAAGLALLLLPFAFLPGGNRGGGTGARSLRGVASRLTAPRPSIECPLKAKGRRRAEAGASASRVSCSPQEDSPSVRLSDCHSVCVEQAEHNPKFSFLMGPT